MALGLLWYPVMRRMGRKWLGAVLALTIGLLVFLLIDTLLEAFEVAGELPGAFQGIPLVLLRRPADLAGRCWRSARPAQAGPAARGQRRAGLYLAGLIAFSIGLHNLGEGLAIGAAFALGEAALGSFLVIGFTLHNITEGIGIAAPLVPPQDEAETAAADLSPGWRFVGPGAAGRIAGDPRGVDRRLRLLAPAGVLFLGMGVGAIWQVIVEVGRLLQSYARRDDTSLAAWPNVAGFALGLAVMYLTALLVKI